MPVKVIALVAVKPGGEEAFLTAANTCVAASRAEAGVLYYDLWREAGEEGRFVFNELYVDDAAVQQHMASDHFEAFGSAIRELVSASPTIVVSHPVDVR
jgi:quinol monooxygenase YgiN